MKLIDADTLVHIPIYNDQTEETSLAEMSIADFLDTFADEGCPPVQPEEAIPVSWIESEIAEMKSAGEASSYILAELIGAMVRKRKEEQQD